MDKTNAMRILELNKLITFEVKRTIITKKAIESISIYLNEDPDKVFKTLVTIGNDKRYYVCVIPVYKELDLKLAAKAFNVKSLEMIHVKDINAITGYIRGGCSPIGMKKVFPTIIDISGKELDMIIFSGGKIGLQIEMNPKDLDKVLRINYSKITRGDE